MSIKQRIWTHCGYILCLILLSILLVDGYLGRYKNTRLWKDKCSKAKQSRCHRDAICLNTRRAYRCRCKPGFYGSGKICVDDNECNYENGGCVHTCTNTHGNYTCSCLPGYQLHKDKHNCIDMDECQLNHMCDYGCENTIGGYKCTCPPHKILDMSGRMCRDKNWCEKRYGCEHFCNPRGSGCMCRNGYILHKDGKKCLQTCAHANGGCHHNCLDGKSGPKCSCHEKYRLKTDGKNCLATCRVNNGGCDRRCHDTVNGPRCACPSGYVIHWDGKTCLDIDECKKNNGGCSHGCKNSHGDYECTCLKGYKVGKDQKTCIDEDECKLNRTCDHICKNTPGSYECYCQNGYGKYGLAHCGDKNECSVNNGGCEHECINKPGSFECRCRAGYQLHSNHKDCVELKVCIPLKVPAKAHLMCKQNGVETSCVLRCQDRAEFLEAAGSKQAFNCGPNTKYKWKNKQRNNTTALPSCSDAVEAPGYKRKARFLFQADSCILHKAATQSFKDNLSQMILARRKFRCTELCQVNYVNLHCAETSRRRKFRHLAKSMVVKAEFELQVTPHSPTGKCNLKCIRRRTEKRLKRTIRKIKKTIDKSQFRVKFDGQDYSVSEKSFRAEKVQPICKPGQILITDKCVSCSMGTYFYLNSSGCSPCPLGSYQDEEGQLSCKICPPGVGLGSVGARNVSECAGQCSPGYFSATGYQPCKPCVRGSYQPEHGRSVCISCGPGIQTSATGSTGFQQCMVREKCPPGKFYNRKTSHCQLCPKSTYQPHSGQDFCVDCPGATTTDIEGATSGNLCKDRRCGGSFNKYQGFIQSPNYPGDYPADVDCTWTIRPEKGRRILVVIPEIHLVGGEKCGDILSMRKSASPYSLLTFETCESSDSPIAFTARTRRLVVKFKSDKMNSAKGFSIPYVTYNEEYQELIEDIVRDGKLYSSQKHQQVLKDEKLRSALMEVIAQPYNYFKYASLSQRMYPESFIRILTQKVKKFFSR